MKTRKNPSRQWMMKFKVCNTDCIMPGFYKHCRDDCILVKKFMVHRNNCGIVEQKHKNRKNTPIDGENTLRYYERRNNNTSIQITFCSMSSASY